MIPKNLARLLIVLCLAFGVLALSVEGTWRDVFGSMQLAFLLCAAYVYWKSLKGT